jgi:TRAP transporter TAXI family solute receptor
VGQRRKKALTESLKIYAPAVLLTLVAFLFAYQFVDPAPPNRLVLAAGPPEGAYAAFAEKYRRYFLREGIQLEVRHTRGSLENLALLASGKVDVAFVQGGTEGAVKAPLKSLGSLYFEPVWLFYRAERVSERLTDLEGGRLAAGSEGSGTLALAQVLLADNDLHPPQVQALHLGGRAAADALLAGKLEAALFVTGADSPLIAELMRAPGVRLMSFRRATAYTRLHPYLSAVLLPEGMIDMLANIPDRDVRLLAPAATLVTREAVHPALLDLLLQTAARVHRGGGWFETEGRFPSRDFTVFPLSPEADRFYRHGPPFLQRYLPFWAATLIDRLKVMLLPLVVILLPLAKIMPPIYSWRMRAKIYRWYKELEDGTRRAGCGRSSTSSSRRCRRSTCPCPSRPRPMTCGCISGWCVTTCRWMSPYEGARAPPQCRVSARAARGCLLRRGTRLLQNGPIRPPRWPAVMDLDAISGIRGDPATFGLRFALRGRQRRRANPVSLGPSRARPPPRPF